MNNFEQSQQESNNDVKYIGKLHSSSYFDRPDKIFCPKSSNFIDSTASDSQHSNVINDSNLFVRSCIFSGDGSHAAWTSGYKIVKLMKFKETRGAMRSFCSNQDFQSELKVNEVTEIECNEIVKSVAFGSSRNNVTTKQVHLGDKKLVENRFKPGDNNLLLAIGLISGKIRIYDATCMSLCMTLNDHKDMINDIKFSQDGSLQLMSASSDETLKLWNMYEDGNMYKTFKGHIGKVNMCAWSPVSKQVVSVGVNRQAFIWDTQSFKLKFSLKGHLHNVSSCVYSPDGALVATACYDTKICLWNPYNGQLIKQFFHMLPPPRLIYAGGDNGAYIRDFSFSKEGDHLISICDDKKIRVWSMVKRTIHPIAIGEMDKIGYSCAYSSSNRTILVGTKTGEVDVYKTPIIVSRLIELCRKVVNKNIRQPVDEIILPGELKRHLAYDDISDQPVQTQPKNSFSMNDYPIMQGTTLFN